MKRKIILIGVLFTLLLVGLPLVAGATSSGRSLLYTDNDNIEHNVDWIIDNNGVLTISPSSYTGTVYSWLMTEISAHRDEIQKVIVSDGIPTLQYQLFGHCTNLKEVILPDGLTYINDYAFTDCTSLELINLPNSIETISTRAFMGCSSLTSINLPLSLTKIGQESFSGCTGLTSIQVPANVTTIQSKAFENCSSLECVNIPESVTTLFGDAFYGCNNIREFHVPEKYHYQSYQIAAGLDSTSFGWCGENAMWVYEPESLNANNVPVYGTLNIYGTGSVDRRIGTNASSVIIASGITSLPESAFSYSIYLSDIDIPDTVTSIGNYAFENCRSLEGIDLPDSVNYLGAGVFSSSGLTSFTYPNTIRNIGDNMFYQCNALEKVDLPEIVESIGFQAFYYCTSLQNLILPNTVESIGSYAFYNCGIEEIQIPDTVLIIGNAAFGECKFESIELPDQLSSISQSLFYGSKNLHNVIIPDSISDIQSYAFYGCSNLNQIELPASIESIASNSFDSGVTFLISCPSYALEWAINNERSYSIQSHDWNEPIYSWSDGNESVTAIRTCKGDSNHIESETVAAIAQVTKPATYFSMGETTYTSDSFANDAFSVQSKVETDIPQIPLPEGWSYGECGKDEDNLIWILDDQGNLTITGTGQMYNYTWNNNQPWGKNINHVIVEEGVTSISQYAFYGSSLSSISVPGSVSSVGNLAFSGCVNLTSISFPNQSITLGNLSFRDCNNLVDIIVPESHINYRIINHILYNKDGTQLLFCPPGISGTVEVPNGVTTIGSGAFSYCNQITSIILPETVNSIGGQAFGDCSKLISINIPYGVTTIKSRTFFQCSSLREIVLPESVTSIASWAFWACRSLHTINFPQNVTCLESQTFYACGFDRLHIPDNITFIADDCFKGTSTVLVATCDSYARTWAETNGFLWIHESPSLTSHEGTEATCTEAGIEAYWDCPVCNKLYSDEEATTEIEAPVAIPAKGHTLTAHVKVEATCTSAGTEAYWDCSACNKLFSDEEATTEIEAPVSIPAKGHTLTAHARVEATCTTAGNEAYWNCSVCNKLFSNEDATTEIEAPVAITATGHTLTAHAKVEAACTTAGNEAYWSCSVCNKRFSDEDATTEIEAPVLIPAMGHLEVTDIAPVAATCAEPGWTGKTHCERCGEILVEQSVIPALGHEEVADEAKAPSCTETGLTEGSHCGRCGEILSAQQIISALGHEEVTDHGVDPACTTPGLSDGIHCSRCGVVIIPQNEIPATGHMEIIDEMVYPTETQSGLTEGKHCSVCGTVITAQQVIPATGSSTVIASGSCGTNIIWKLTDNGVLALSGTGAMNNYSGYNNTAPWYNNRYSVKYVTISEGITSIGDYAFYFVPIQSLSIPASVTRIGNQALIGNSLNIISVETGNLYYVSEQGILFNHEKTTLIKCPENMVSAYIPDSVTRIGDNAFYNCNRLKAVHIPESVEVIGNSAFSNCSSLNSIYIPESVKTIGGGAFYFCSSLTEINIPYGISYIGNQTFCGCSLSSIDIPNSVTSISSFAFSYNRNLTSMIIPNSVTAISDYAFSNCENLEIIVIPMSVTNINGNNLFASCTKLSISCHPGSAAESYAMSLGLNYTNEGHEEIADTAVEATCTEDGMTIGTHCEICGTLIAQEIIPALGHEWETDYIWSDDDSFVTAFRTCRNGNHSEMETVPTERILTMVPEETTAGTYKIVSIAFMNPDFEIQEKIGLPIPALGDMNKLILPASLKIIGVGAFDSIAAEAVIIPDNCTAIEPEAFVNCQNLLYARIPAGVEIPADAFIGCPNVVIDQR